MKLCDKHRESQDGPACSEDRCVICQLSARLAKLEATVFAYTPVYLAHYESRFIGESQE